ncbi:hypothetical protein BC832DRAFT_610594 [Gaertneriomyces semiglobifer]|nr:hypothetical protein BC832DRAFT_610594 [Gaertneriomyces semiglobifer]
MSDASHIVVPIRLVPQWNWPLISVSYVVSVLGAYTTTQLMTNVSQCRNLPEKLRWIGMASMSFGGCAVWSMHFIGMLAMDLGIRVRFDIVMTVASAVIAILVAFVTFSMEVIFAKWRQHQSRKNVRRPRRKVRRTTSEIQINPFGSKSRSSNRKRTAILDPYPDSEYHMLGGTSSEGFGASILANKPAEVCVPMPGDEFPSEQHALGTSSENESDSDVSQDDSSSEEHHAHRRDTISSWLSSNEDQSAFLGSSDEMGRRSDEHTTQVIGVRFDGTDIMAPRSDACRASHLSIVSRIICKFCKMVNLRIVVKGLLLGLTASGMHYTGMAAMEMDAVIVYNKLYVVCSILIGWLSGLIAFMFMPLEINLVSQLSFSFTAAFGVASMHYCGMLAADFYTTLPPPYDHGGYPASLPLTIAGVAILTCFVSFVALAHAVSLSRNKLQEVIQTKRRLWRVIAEKEAAIRENRLKTDFISVASHEIRTPLHAVTGYTDLLAETHLTHEQRVYVDCIKTGCQTIQLITSNVLDFAKLERANKESSANPVFLDLRKLGTDIVRSCAFEKRRVRRKEQAQSCMNESSSHLPGASSSTLSPHDLDDHGTDVELIMDIEKEVPDEIYADEVYLTRVIMNLVSNALKFTTKGYVLLHVSWDVSNGPGSPESSRGSLPALLPHLVIVVRDTGEGIPQDFLARLFEPFRQADTSLTRQHDGTGLGLAICKQLVERMSGTIDVESSSGYGSSFTVRIPMPENLTARVVHTHGSRGTVERLDEGSAWSQPGALTPEVRGVRRSIALCCRNEQVARVLSSMLIRHGYDVSVILHSSSPGSTEQVRNANIVWCDMEVWYESQHRLRKLLRRNRIGKRRQNSVLLLFHSEQLRTNTKTVDKVRGARVVFYKRPLIIHEIVRLSELTLYRNTSDSDVTEDAPGSESDTFSVANEADFDHTIGLSERISTSAAITPTPKIMSSSTFFPSIEGTDTSLGPTHSSSSPNLLGTAAAPAPGSAVWQRRVSFVDTHSPYCAVPPGEVQTSSGTIFSSGYGSPQPSSSHVHSSNSERKRPIGRVLLVEDNAVNQKLGMRMLQRLNFDVDVAANGLEALQMITGIEDLVPSDDTDSDWESRIRTPASVVASLTRNARDIPSRMNKYCIVLMDCQMPVMSGFEAARCIRAFEESLPHDNVNPRPHIVIIALTANVSEESKEKCEDAGMDYFLSKPIQLSVLRAAIGRFVTIDSEHPNV